MSVPDDELALPTRIESSLDLATFIETLLRSYTSPASSGDLNRYFEALIHGCEASLGEMPRSDAEINRSDTTSWAFVAHIVADALQAAS